MLNSIYILTKDGEVLIEKHYSGYRDRASVDTLLVQMNKYSDQEEVPPIFNLINGKKEIVFGASSKSHQPPCFFFSSSLAIAVQIKQKDLIFVALLNKEKQVFGVVDFLLRLIDTLVSFIGDEVVEATVKNHFTTVYLVMDEMMDGGVPNTTELSLLREVVGDRGITTRLISSVPGSIAGVELPEMFRETLEKSQRTSAQNGLDIDFVMSSPFPWRRSGLKYLSNKVYIDITERIDCLIDRNQMIISMEVMGDVQLTCELSGMPETSLVFNKPSLIDDASFHHCVQLQRWLSGRVVACVPPDGTFKLMTYKINQQLPLPIYCSPQLLFTNAGGKVEVTVGAKQTGGKPLDDVVVTIPFSKTHCGTAMLTATQGEVQFDDATKECKWIIGRLHAEGEAARLSGTITSSSGLMPESSPTVQLDFSMQSGVSGLRIEQFNIIKESYQPFKGFKVSSRAGQFHVRS